jgi:hypothetical protein
VKSDSVDCLRRSLFPPLGARRRGSSVDRRPMLSWRDGGRRWSPERRRSCSLREEEVEDEDGGRLSSSSISRDNGENLSGGRATGLLLSSREGGRDEEPDRDRRRISSPLESLRGSCFARVSMWAVDNRGDVATSGSLGFGEVCLS